MWSDTRRELLRWRWVLAAAPLAGAAVAGAVFAVCMAAADAVLAVDAFNSDDEEAFT